MSKNWPKVRLEEVLAPVSRPVRVEPTTAYSILGAHWYAKGLYIKETLSGTEIQAKNLYRVEEGDFVYNRLFGWKGSFAIASKENHNCYVSNEFPCFVVTPNRADRKYVCNYFSLPSVWDTVLSLSSGGTPTSRNRLKEEQLLKMEIPLPAIEEQQRIVNRIEILTSRVELARNMRRRISEHEIPALRDLAFSQILKFDPEKSTFGSWPMARLEEVCSVITDGTHQTPRYVDTGTPFLSAQNIKPYKFMPEVHRKVSVDDYTGYVRNTKPEMGDVLMTRVGAMIGEAAMIDRELDFAFYASLCLMKLKKNLIYPPFLVHWLNSPFGSKATREKTLGKGHSQGNLNLKLIREIKIPLPSLDEQEGLAHSLDKVLSAVNSAGELQAQVSTELDALMPSILDKVFKGEL